MLQVQEAEQKECGAGEDAPLIWALRPTNVGGVKKLWKNLCICDA